MIWAKGALDDLQPGGRGDLNDTVNLDRHAHWELRDTNGGAGMTTSLLAKDAHQDVRGGVGNNGLLGERVVAVHEHVDPHDLNHAVEVSVAGVLDLCDEVNNGSAGGLLGNGDVNATLHGASVVDGAGDKGSIHLLGDLAGDVDQVASDDKGDVVCNWGRGLRDDKAELDKVGSDAGHANLGCVELSKRERGETSHK